MTMTNEEMVAEIKRLQKERDAVIMAHYYVPAEVQEIADFIGDSFFLSKKGTELDCRTIILAGVRFMAESCKVLNPEKTVLLPASDADCPMAHMATVEKIKEQRKLHPTDLAVVCYVNSTVEIKAESDVCVTSANAVKVVSRLKEHYIYFVPDQNLAHYVAKQCPDKEFIFNDGYCHVHHGVSVEDVKELKAFYPNAPVLVHPECREEVLALCDHIALLSGQGEEPQGLLQLLPYADPLKVHDAEVVLRCRKALIRRLPVPRGSLVVILRDSVPLNQHVAYG